MIPKLTKLFTEFFESEKISGIILICCTIVSLVLANSSFGKDYVDFWQNKIGLEASGIVLKYSIEHWINDGLMAIFFLLIGLEIERELYCGELSGLKNASLPVFAAIGGMAVPALLHFLINGGTATQAGFGIPIATDIAFALGILALLGKRVPISIKIFIASLAIIDDLGSIVIIAIFYMGDLSLLNFLGAMGIFIALLIMNRFRVHRLSLYLIPGLFMWFFMLQSGIHPTITGVLLAFAIPFANGNENSPSYKLQHFLHKPATLIIIPLFALANTCVPLTGKWMEGLLTSNSLGIFAGLFFGKPMGILLFSLLAIKTGFSQLPDQVSWKHIVGAGFLGGIGFTMSIFITLLAFSNSAIVQSSKISILLSSLAAAIVGFLILSRQKHNTGEDSF